jgi:AraC-like DNA-binding protein
MAGALPHARRMLPGRLGEHAAYLRPGVPHLPSARTGVWCAHLARRQPLPHGGCRPRDAQRWRHVLDFERLNAARRAPPHWLAFQLRRELETADDLSPTSVAHTLVALLTELAERPGLEARSTPPPWLERVQEQIHDEFRRHHTLESLAREAGFHHVHLAREFRRRYGCTVGHYIRQRRVEFGCHRLTASLDPLSEIALDAGFADQSHFTNTFCQLVGLSPAVFRTRFFAPPRQLAA